MKNDNDSILGLQSDLLLSFETIFLEKDLEDKKLKEAYDNFKIKYSDLKRQYKLTKKDDRSIFFKCIFYIFKTLQNKHKDLLLRIVKECLIEDSDMLPGRLFLETAKLNRALFHPGISDLSTYEYALYNFKAAKTDKPVLILGETGTGKEFIARTIHDLSEKRSLVFRAFNCAGIPETLLESELFGYEKGAFSGAIKSRRGLLETVGEGTLFLDEIGDMPLPMQAKLLRVLETKDFYKVGGEYKKPLKFEGRIIAATNKDLKKVIEAGNFREDLYYRINTFIIKLPTLRAYSKKDRKFIIPRKLRDISETEGINKSLDEDALSTLLEYDFKGNFRELHNVLIHALYQSEGQSIRKKDLHPDILMLPPREAPNLRSDLLNMPYREMIEYFKDMEKQKLEHLLKEKRGNVEGLARDLEENPQPLRRQIKELGIDPKKYRKGF